MLAARPLLREWLPRRRGPLQKHFTFSFGSWKGERSTKERRSAAVIGNAGWSRVYHAEGPYRTGPSFQPSPHSKWARCERLPFALPFFFSLARTRCVVLGPQHRKESASEKAGTGMRKSR